MNTAMKLRLGLAFLLIPGFVCADETLYCPQNHGYITLGMTADEVLTACGKPVVVEVSKQPLQEKIPVQQLIYNNKGTRVVQYGQWNLQTGFDGATLQINLVDDKVKSILVDGNNSNMASFCEGNTVQIGDDAGKVYYACGTPSVINDTYITQPMKTKSKPEIWIYQPGSYQPSITLTFIDGRLQSIN